MANTLTLYQQLKKRGFRDDHIILMNALDASCDSRNPYPGEVFADTKIESSVFDEITEIDYAGEDVNFKSIFELLSGRHSPCSSLSKRLQTDRNANLLIFLTGHGGDGFFKFQDYEEISADDFAVLFYEMYLKRRYNHILFLVDTCQASTLTSGFAEYLPGFVSISSSSQGENSYAYLTNPFLGISVIDRFTFSLSTFLRSTLRVGSTPKSDVMKMTTIQDLFNSFNRNFLHSTPVLQSYRVFSRNEKDLVDESALKIFLPSEVEMLVVRKENRKFRQTPLRIETRSSQTYEIYHNLLSHLYLLPTRILDYKL